MANFAVALRNPIDITSDEIIEYLCEMGRDRDDLEMLCYQQLLNIIKDLEF